MKENAKRIVIIDDEPDVVRLLHQICATAGYAVESTASAADFHRLLMTRPDFVLLDLLMPDIDGVELLRHLADEHIESAIILISGADPRVLQSVARLAATKGLHVQGTLAKPFNPSELLRLLAQNPSEHIEYENGVIETVQPDELFSALRTNQLIAYFQPQVDLATGKPISCEALVRWQHPNQGLIFPDRFIPVAEQSGIIGELTENIAAQTFRHCAALSAAGHNIRCAINVSALSLADIHFPDRLLTMLSSEKISPASVVVEITESRLYDNTVHAMDVLTRLRMKGIELSIDDFGTGYSNLRQLQLMPFNELKIDKGFIRNCETDKESESIVRSSIELGQRLGIRTVAEGVETAELAERLRGWGCNIGQGFFYAKALPSDAFSLWLREFRLKTLNKPCFKECMKKILFLALCLAGVFLVHAEQQTIIDSEDTRIRARMTAKGFACRENAPQGNSDKFETRIPMAKHTIYYMALITGNGGSTARTKALTLINQRKSVKKLEYQNTPFGTELSIKPNSEGEKVLKFELTKKSDYRFTVCTIQASIYRVDDGMPAIQDYGNF